MMRRFALLAAPLVLLSASTMAEEPTAAPAEPRTENVVIETSLGKITVALETERAPITSANFLRYVDTRRFDGTSFYRAMHLKWGPQPNGLVQGGTQMDPKRILPPIAHEPTNQTGVKHLAGTISMARYAPGTATGDFSIMMQDMPSLDANLKAKDSDGLAGFAAFGHVVEGMDVVQMIFDSPVSATKGDGAMKGQMLEQPVTIVKVRRVKGK